MKKTKLLPIFTLASALFMGVTACNGNGGGGSTPTPAPKFSFSLSLQSGSNSLYVGETDYVVITETNADPAATYSYTVTLSGVENPSKYLSYSIEGKKIKLDPLKVTGKDADNNDVYINISVKEASVRAPKTVSYTIINRSTEAHAAYNYASSISDEAKEERTHILGELEKYAVENYLTGITLFENGGWTRYSKRITIPATEYITGYGWGILSEGKLNSKLDGVQDDHPFHLQSASSSDPLSLNAWDATGSQVSDLNSYISASYWGTRMKIGSTTEYEWYPLLAKDFIEVNGQTIKNNRPVRAEEPNALNMYKRWRVYVKTGAEEGIKYRTASEDEDMSKYNNREVALEDYETTLQMLLSQESNVVRGAELAGDTSYGIKGGQSYFTRTRDKRDEVVTIFEDGVQKQVRQLDYIWEQMKASGELGIKTGVDPVNGSYIEIELVNPIDEFTAMYTLSSNLWTPMPKSFLRAIGGDDFTAGARLYGTFPDVDTDVRDLTLCVGPYYLEEYTKDTQVIFTRNDDWFEYKNKAMMDPLNPNKKLYGDRYNIDGVRIRVITAMAEAGGEEILWNHFTKTKDVDSTNVPKSKMSELGNGEGQDKKSEGDATFKLNVNACTQDRWNELFGDSGSIKALGDNEYKVKPWMSNKNFLKGLYWSINRKQFAEKRGVNPSYNYFSASYLSDPEKGVSYNSTDDHAKAVANIHNGTGASDDYGYDVTTARNAFRAAINELKLPVGTQTNPNTITIHIKWMYETDIKNYGEDIINDLEYAFNGAMDGIKLVVTQDAVTNWIDVYYQYLMLGKYDLGFGAISGNTYNPLNFMEVLKSDNSSTFTLNWGADTSIVDPVNPIVYDGKTWSYDALWAAADHGTVVKKGRDVNPVSNCFLSETSTDKLYEGGSFVIPFAFVNLDEAADSVELEVLTVKLFLSGYGNVLIEKYDPQKDQKIYYEITSSGYKITITAAGGEDFNQKLIDFNDLERKKNSTTDAIKQELYTHPFVYNSYYSRDIAQEFYWDIEFSYSMAIGKQDEHGTWSYGIPTESTFVAYSDLDDQTDHKKN